MYSLTKFIVYLGIQTRCTIWGGKYRRNLIMHLALPHTVRIWRLGELKQNTEKKLYSGGQFFPHIIFRLPLLGTELCGSCAAPRGFPSPQSQGSLGQYAVLFH